ncbi:Putative aminoacrylate peracid reductase RutC [Aquisphaera giovannonii]|uniref:Aminoacrylate peracid reductase RutC n=2 Tax=Aquisphaera giovannonii TaxID=406548 RepID=A0A5B9W8P1_9BACT|nr:Putative aminoacrylate peracid reductase RutC [Aquisphaera giovannonii]
MLRKVSRDGCGYSVVELYDVRHVLAVAVPRGGGSLEVQAHDALRTIEAVHAEEGTRGSIVHQAVFIPTPELVPQCREIIRDFYGDEQPATSYVVQPPCDGKLLAVEAMGVGRGMGEVRIERFGDQAVRVTHNALSWLHCANVTPRDDVTGVYNQTISAMSRMRGVLAKRGIGFDRVIRMWNYLGSIVEDEGGVQRYKELNRARTAFFEGVHFLRGCQAGLPSSAEVYPAATGIGMQGTGLMLGCIALAMDDRPDVVAMPLENPNQTAAFHYGARYSPKSPKFARAMALSCGAFATIFVSGTASILGAETVHPGDAEAQTRQTLDNIEALISERNLRQHGLPGLGARLEDLGMIRVYVKRQDDYETARAVCRARLGDLPMVFAIADVCRPDLLVEIEGMAFSRRK